MSEPENRGGRGPWARLFARTAVGDESSTTAELGRRLALDVDDVEVDVGTLAARVGDERATIGAEPIPPQIWAAISSFSRGNPPLEAALAGRGQSLHLEHLLTEDWDEPLVPLALERTCTCEADGVRTCEHVVALAYAAAERIDRDPSLLLRWRGQGVPHDAEPADPAPEPTEETALAADPTVDPWLAGPLPTPQAVRPLPVAAVLKRLGRSGVHVGGRDLEDVLEQAYAAFASTPR